MTDNGPRSTDSGPFTNIALLTRARLAFTARFGGEPAVLGFAPGRVELLGNHTDYNGGLVMAAAIDRSTVVVGRRSAGREVRAVAVNFGQTDDFSLDEIERTEAGAWTRYVRGVCWAMNEWRGPLRSGFDAAIAGDVPLGAGLSSSASLQASFAWLLIQLGLLPGRSSHDFNGNQNDPLRMELAQALRRSENEFVGVGSGLLDQFSSLFGRADHALFLDCDTLTHDTLPLGKLAPAIVVCDSKTSRRLADGMYDRLSRGMRPGRRVLSRKDPPTRRVTTFPADTRTAPDRMGPARPGRAKTGPARIERKRARAPRVSKP